MTLNEFQTERTRIISEMLDNPDKYGIYPTTKCFESLDKLFLESQLSEPDKELGEWKLPTTYQLGRLIAELHTSNDPQAKLLIDHLKSKINTNN